MRIPFVFTSETRTRTGLRRAWHVDHIEAEVPEFSSRSMEPVRIAATLTSGKQSDLEIRAHVRDGRMYATRPPASSDGHAAEWIANAVAGRKGNFSGRPILPVGGLAALPVADSGCLVDFAPFDSAACESDTRDFWRKRAEVYAADLARVDGTLLSSSMEPTVCTLMKGENLGRSRWIGRIVMKDVHDLWRNRGFSHTRMEHGMVMPPYIDLATQAKGDVAAEFAAFSVEGDLSGWRPRLPEIDVNCFEALKWAWDETTADDRYRLAGGFDPILPRIAATLESYEDPTASLPDPQVAGALVLETAAAMERDTGDLARHLRRMVLRVQPTLERFVPYWHARGRMLADAATASRTADPADFAEDDLGGFRL